MRTRTSWCPHRGGRGTRCPASLAGRSQDEGTALQLAGFEEVARLQLQRGVVGQGSEGPGRAQFLGRDLVPVHLRLAVLRGEMEPLEALGLLRTAGLGRTQVPWNGLRSGDASCGATRSGLVSSSGVGTASWRARGRNWAGPPTPGTQRSLVSSWPATQGACQAPAWAAGCHWRRPSSCTPCSSLSACSRWATRRWGTWSRRPLAPCRSGSGNRWIRRWSR
jgi:hypothetical protein